MYQLLPLMGPFQGATSSPNFSSHASKAQGGLSWLVLCVVHELFLKTTSPPEPLVQIQEAFT